MTENYLLYETLKYDRYLKKMLQKNITMLLNEKIIKSGNLILYSYKNFSIQLIFKNPKTGKNRKTEIPIPFNIKKINENDLIFSYMLDNIDADATKYNTNNKFFNKNLIIKIEQ